MEIRNGQEILSEPYILDPTLDRASVTYTDSHTVTWDESGNTLIMNSSSNKIFTLPVGSASYLGRWVTFANINTGRLTIQAGTANYIDDSSAAGTIYSDDNSIPTITLELMSAAKWMIVSANGIWTST